MRSQMSTGQVMCSKVKLQNFMFETNENMRSFILADNLNIKELQMNTCIKAFGRIVQIRWAEFIYF